MERIELLSAARPRHYAGDPDSITLDVRFAHLPDPVQFAARKDDTEVHGRELYSRAVFGEFGDVEVIPVPPPTEARAGPPRCAAQTGNQCHGPAARRRGVGHHQRDRA